MRKSGFFPRLALVNIARNSRFYLPYLLRSEEHTSELQSQR